MNKFNNNTMSEQTDKFVQEMLKKAQEEKKEAKPQNRFEGVNPDNIEKITENIQEMIQKGKKKS